MPPKREITRDDIMAMDAFSAIRKQRRAEVSAIKRGRRVEVGPAATLYFESFDTMWWQIHEMLYIEKGGEEQIAGELDAFNPLIPKGDELVATLMFEIDDPARRGALLERLGGVEHTVTLTVAGEAVRAVSEGDVERSDAAGRASSVHFLHFPFTAGQIKAFRAPGAAVVAGIGHPEYAHMAVLPEPVRQALSVDFD